MMELDKLYKLFISARRLSTDSRKLEPGCIYLALKGERFDGNKFALDALSKGASYAIVDDKNLAGQDRCIYVENTLVTLHLLANQHRKLFKGTVIGITGSNGKTTTKELIYSVLSKVAKTHSTKGNLNNHIGVPLTILEMKLDEQFAIIEMGANHQGEIKELSNIAEPDLGIITNIGKAHLEGFGGIEGVKKSKAELFNFLQQHHRTAIVNADEKKLLSIVQKDLDCKYYGSDCTNESLDFCIEHVQLEPYIVYQFTDKNGISCRGKSALIGLHNFQNIKTAIAVGLYLKIHGKDIIQGIESYVANSNRSQFIETKHNRVYLDAYNANPDSVANSLKAFFKLEGDKKIVVLGDMLELGEYSLDEHQRIYELAVTHEPDGIFLVGNEFYKIDAPSQIKFSSLASLRSQLSKMEWKNALIFIKASRGIRLEELIDVF